MPDILTADSLAAAARMPLERAQRWVDPLNYVLPFYGIDTPRRLAAFIAQCGHESMGFSTLVEDLNYSVGGLMRTWPTRFPTAEQAALYAHNPEKLANFVYAGRNGNGDAASGDGFRFRGRGLLQITGRGNYLAASQAIFGSDRLVSYPEHVAESLYVAAATAADYWRRNGLNEKADLGAFLAIGNLINTGSERRKAIGTADRIARTETAMEVLA
jgi:putative chitinase